MRIPENIGLGVKGSKRADVEDQSQLNGEGSVTIMADQARWNSMKSPGTDTNSTEGAKNHRLATLSNHRSDKTKGICTCT